MSNNWIARRSLRTRARIIFAVFLLVPLAAVGLIAQTAVRVGWDLGLVGLVAFPLGLIGGRAVGRSRRPARSNGAIYFVAIVAAGVSRALAPIAQLVCFAFVAGALAVLSAPLFNRLRHIARAAESSDAHRG